MEKMTKQKLDVAIKEANDIFRRISNIVRTLVEKWSLGDLVAEEQNLENRCYELQEKIKEVVYLRQWLGFEIKE